MSSQIELYANNSSTPIIASKLFFKFCLKPKNDLFKNESLSQRNNRCRIRHPSAYSDSKKYCYDEIDYGTLAKIVEWIEYHKSDERMKQLKYNRADFFSDHERLEMMSQGFKLSNHYFALNKTPILSEWDTSFFKMPLRDLVMLYKSSYELHALFLAEMCAQSIASRMKDKTTEELKRLFNVTDKLAPEELTKIKMEYAFIEEY